MACATPVVASRIAALIEVGGPAATYCPVGDVGAWVAAISELLDERSAASTDWSARRAASLAQSRRFSWREHARQMTELYRDLLPHLRAGAATDSRPHNERASRPASREVLPARSRRHRDRRRDAVSRRARRRSRRRALVLNKVNRTTEEIVNGVPVRRVASVATIGAVSVAPSLPHWLARARGRRHRAARTESDGAAGLCAGAAHGPADRVDSQRGDPPEAAVSAVLRAAARVRAATGPADRRGVAADAADPGARPVSAQVHRDSVRSRAVRAIGRHERHRVAGEGHSGQDQRAHRAVRRTTGRLQGCRRAPAGHEGSRRRDGHRRRRSASHVADGAGVRSGHQRPRALRGRRLRGGTAGVVSRLRRPGAAVGQQAGSLRHGAARGHAVSAIRWSARSCRPGRPGSISTSGPASS